MNALVERGIDHAFMVAGGGAMYLNDAVGMHPEIETVCMLHEQAAAIASEAFTKVSGRLALCMVTSGPGGTNAITGVAGAWLDSTPMIVISGQVKRADLVGDTGVRQRGVQELSMSDLVRSITKYAALIDQPESVRYQLERALYSATSGRPGPVWLEVPLDVQGAVVDPDLLQGFDPHQMARDETLDRPALAAAAATVARCCGTANAPSFWSEPAFACPDAKVRSSSWWKGYGFRFSRHGRPWASSVMSIRSTSADLAPWLRGARTLRCRMPISFSVSVHASTSSRRGMTRRTSVAGHAKSSLTLIRSNSPSWRVPSEMASLRRCRSIHFGVVANSWHARHQAHRIMASAMR